MHQLVLITESDYVHLDYLPNNVIYQSEYLLVVLVCDVIYKWTPPHILIGFLERLTFRFQGTLSKILITN